MTLTQGGLRICCEEKKVATEEFTRIPIDPQESAAVIVTLGTSVSTGDTNPNGRRNCLRTKDPTTQSEGPNVCPVPNPNI